jgi:hypothetical protein
MTTPEKSVEEIVENLIQDIGIVKDEIDYQVPKTPILVTPYELEERLLKVIQAELQKRDDNVADYLIKYPDASLADYYADTALTKPNNK